MLPFLLEFIDSGFMTAVFYLMAFGAAVVAVAAIVGLWRLTRAGVRRWQSIRAAPQPVPLSQRLGAVLLVLPATVVGLLAVCSLILGVWFNKREQEGMHKHAAAVQQHQVTTRAALEGHYFLADSMLLTASDESFVTPAWTALVHADLILRPDSTYSYHSSIPADVTIDTTGTWKMVGYQYDERFNYEQFAVVFSPATRRACGLSISREANGPIYSNGAYYRNDGYTPFKLILARTPDQGLAK